jgi:hypothetical protein
MALPEFRGLIDWCAGSGTARRRQVMGALVYHYDGPCAHGAWRGVLTCSQPAADGAEARFDGVLRAIPGGDVRRDPLALTIRVTDDGAWAGLRGEGVDDAWANGLPVVDIAVRAGVIEARFETGSADQHISCFASPAYD